jgi:SAM-dependent methyltransferase
MPEAMPDISTGQVWASGEAYEPFIGRWSRRVAPRFLDWLAVPAAMRWLDVGCGTGALSQAVLDVAEPARLVGLDPSSTFVEVAREHVRDRRASFQVGNAMGLPFGAAAFDACVAGLALNFVPDPGTAVAEMRRVTAGSGVVAAYVWDYAGEMQVLRRFWSAAAELDPAAVDLDEGTRCGVCRPAELRACFEGAGLTGVQLTNLDVDARFGDFDDYWRPFLGGQGPAPAYLATLDPEARSRLREHLRKTLPIAADGSLTLLARAMAVKGFV